MKIFILTWTFFSFLLLWFGAGGTAFSAPVQDNEIIMTAKQFEVLGKEKTAKAIGKVKLVRGELRIDADEALYLENKKEVLLVGKSQPIRIRFEDIQGVCGKARYLLKEKKIILSVAPHVDRGKDHLEGEIIEFYLGEKRVRVRGNSKVKIGEDVLKREGMGP